jgi:DNA-binding transcriptional LysR family regulator
MQKDAASRAANPAHQLSFDDLQVFARIAKLGSLSAVARERDVPVSQVTRALQRIEAAYRIRMVHRSTHALSLTPEGQSFLAHCERMEEAHFLIETDLGLHSTDIHGTVRVSASDVFANHVLIPGLPALRKRHPRMVIDLRVEDKLVDMSRDGIDIAIRTAVPNSDLLVQRSLGEFRRALYASPAYLDEHGTPASIADLAHHHIIANSRPGNHTLWRFKVDGVSSTLSPQGHIQTDNSQTHLDMTLAGLGISRMADIVVNPLVKRGLLVPVLAELIDETPVPMNAVMLSERHRLPKVRACIDHWVSYLAKLNSKP